MPFSNGRSPDPSANWDASFPWGNVLPPSRPSLEQLEFFRPSILRANKSTPVLVLGSTPEYRDLLGVLGFKQIFVFDKSPSFHKQASILRSWSNKENVVFGDWRELLPKYQDTFSLILSDLTSGNVPYSDRSTFYSSIARALTAEGCFLDKILTHHRPLRGLSVLYHRYKTVPLNQATINRWNNEVLFTSEILSSGVLQTTEAYSLLEEIGTEGFWPLYVRANTTITPANCLWYYGKPYPAVEDVYSSALRIIDRAEEPEHSPYSGYCFWSVARRAQ